MDTIKEKLNRITNFWNHFIWESKLLQKQIRFNEDVKTNYYGDILVYFDDTLDLLKDVKKHREGFKDNIFYSIGILQIIYVHQDLIDELLYIFAIDKSSKKDKNPNREIRNELIGHPIRRSRDNELQSSVIFGNKLSNDLLHYVKYDRRHEFEGHQVEYDFDTIIEQHQAFLNKYLDLVWEKAKKILKNYDRKLTEFEKVIDNNVEFEKVLALTDQRYNRIFKTNHLFNQEYLLECHNRQMDHRRYGHAIELFMNELIESIKGSKENIEVLLHPNTVESSVLPSDNIKIVFSPANANEVQSSNGTKTYAYEMGKLHRRHPIWGIKFFKTEFEHNAPVMEELENMENHYHSDLEYYCSFELISYLIENSQRQTDT